MNPLTLAILLQLVGVGVIIAEIIIPSGGLISVIAVVIFGYSLFIVFHDLSASIGIVFVIMDVITIPALILVGLKLLAKSPATLKTRLSRTEGITSQSPELEGYINKEGKTVTDLHPAGIALIDGKRIDVVSRGEYIDKNCAIVVSKVTGNQVIVRKKEESTS